MTADSSPENNTPANAGENRAKPSRIAGQWLVLLVAGAVAVFLLIYLGCTGYFTQQFKDAVDRAKEPARERTVPRP